MSLLRNPPIPPPKPKGYLPNGFQHKMVEAPQDSDTDSGICADSDQSSPRQPQQPSFPSYRPPTFPYRSAATAVDDRDYLTPNSARRLFSSDSPRRTLPPRPSVVAARTTKGYRVRFADEVDSGASTSSSASENSNPSPRQDPPAPIRHNSPSFTKPLPPVVHHHHGHHNNTINNNNNNGFSLYEQRPPERRFDSLPRPSPHQVRRPSQPASFSIDDVEGLPEPPSYAVAIQRLRSMDAPRESLRDSVIRQNVADSLSRTLRNRSASLPRGVDRVGLNAFYGQERPSMVDYQMNRLMPEQLLGSLDNLRINTDMDYGMLDDFSSLKRRRLPMAPLRGSATNIPDAIDAQRETIRQPAFMRQRRLRGRVPPSLSRRSASVGRYEDEYDYRPPEPSVRAQLVALDQRGFRTVLVEKTQPGPFGFYIATGLMNGQRGIFISRVSLPSLSPMLSVGDEILYVDDELVKGRSLEHVQALIAGKTAVVIVLLPTVGNALC